jgi:hypothetical protein
MSGFYTLEEIRKKYPKANYEPNYMCGYCGGTGDIQKVIKGKMVTVPCVCIYVGDHADLVQGIINNIIKGG